MNNIQFCSFLDLQQISNTNFAKLFYKAACDFNGNSKIDYLKLIDRYKFYQFIAIFTKNDEINKIKNYYKKWRKNSKNNTFTTLIKLRFLNSLFYVDNNKEVDGLEFRNFISSFKLNIWYKKPKKPIKPINAINSLKDLRMTADYNIAFNNRMKESIGNLNCHLDNFHQDRNFLKDEVGYLFKEYDRNRSNFHKDFFNSLNNGMKQVKKEINNTISEYMNTMEEELKN